MDLNHLIDLISQLPENSQMNYVRGESACTFVRIDKSEIRLYAKTPEGKDVAFAESFLSELAQRIEPNVAFNTSQLLNNKGSNRAVVDSIIANTAEFYWITKDRAKFTVWIPSKPHEPGILVEWTDLDFINRETSLLHQIQPVSPKTVRDCFIHFWKMTDEHGADYENYISLFESTVNPYIKAEINFNSVFEITDYKQYKQILDAIISKYGELSYLSSPNLGGDKYRVYSTHKHYVTFLNILQETAKITRQKPKTLHHSLKVHSSYRHYIAAIKSKPFLLLAGISGTGKSRIVRELARACWDEDSEEFKAQKPKNFEMIQVKPNWHDSSELIGYVSRVSGKAEFVAGKLLKFIAKAWEDTDTPYFLCLDEMNLAPVEQYFAEYLSVIESRKSHEDGLVTTDPILEKVDEEWYFNLTASLTMKDDIRKKFNKEGICIPQNLIVVGTVNMDETTFSFSRKVLDRAMTIEMNEVDLDAGLTERYEHIEKLGYEELIGTAVEGVDVYSDNREVCDKALNYLKAVNTVLEGTPFKVAYRTRNEFLLYVVNNLPYNKDEEGNELPDGYVIARTLDEVTNMKILSRIEGDDTKVTDSLLDNLKRVITEKLVNISDGFPIEKSVSLKKLNEMKQRLISGYTSFWS
ncbi:McrB family protein [Phocaeicola barnesiae]|uniref:AAA family ATPase n=1 Tax=Phocaeicola barnesiae TaxID=376804 RepID=A0AAW5NB42_9BACT|nr:AAA family ATPase [Phocaeicola barnesiae]MCR8875325.1 AAA family ATPase [Phocaeicola barnesiae]